RLVRGFDAGDRLGHRFGRLRRVLGDRDRGGGEVLARAGDGGQRRADLAGLGLRLLVGGDLAGDVGPGDRVAEEPAVRAGDAVELGAHGVPAGGQQGAATV